MRDPAFTKGADFVERERDAGLRHDPRADLLAVLLIGNANHLDVLNLRVAVEKLLDPGRIDVLPAPNHHVFDAPDDVAVALGIERREVAGVHPARLVYGLGRTRWIVPVSEHHRVPARAELAWAARRHDLSLLVDDLHLDVRVNASDRGDAPLEGILRRRLEAHRARFGHAVADRHLLHVHLGNDALHHLD